MIQDYIRVFENIVPLSLCDALCDEFRNSDEWADTAVTAAHGGNAVIDKNIRSATTIVLSLPNVISKNKEVRLQLDLDLFKSAGIAMQQYLGLYPEARVVRDTGYELLRYQTGQFYTQHTDASSNNNRCISCSFLLNDDYEGGEFAFFNRKTIVNAPKGGAIMFPSNFIFPHEILPVMSGTRYSVVTWFV